MHWGRAEDTAMPSGRFFSAMLLIAFSSGDAAAHGVKPSSETEPLNPPIY